MTLCDDCFPLPLDPHHQPADEEPEGQRGDDGCT